MIKLKARHKKKKKIYNVLELYENDLYLEKLWNDVKYKDVILLKALWKKDRSWYDIYDWDLVEIRFWDDKYVMDEYKWKIYRYVVALHYWNTELVDFCNISSHKLCILWNVYENRELFDDDNCLYL